MKTKSWEQAFDTACADGLIKTYPKFEVDVIGIKQFIKSLLHQERKRVIEECETLINYSEGRASGLECSQAGYEYGVEDVLSIFKKRSKE